MKNNIQYDDALEDFKNLPHVSLIIPFCSEMTKETTLAKLLASAVDEAIQNLLRKHPEEKARPVINNLRHLVKNVKCSKDEKTLAIFVTPFAQKIYYFTPSIVKKIHLSVLVKNND